MRADALIALPSRAEHWTQTRTQDDSGAVTVTYTFNANIKLVVLDTANNAPVVFTRARMTFNDKLVNMRDAAGNEIFPLSQPAEEIYVGRGMPVFDVFGSVIGYRHIITAKYGGNV